jgi:SAM-dependent methyltransferase
MLMRYDFWRVGWNLKTSLPAQIAASAEAVCEIGAGARPLLPPRPNYTLIDVSAVELAKAGDEYSKFVADIAAPGFEPPGSFDFVFSLSTAEHIREPAVFHSNVRRLLRTGGTAMHFFPTLYALPFVANRLLPHGLAERLLLKIDPARQPEGEHAKFQAYYAWCRGPSARQTERLERCGFRVREYHGYYGHGYYRRLPIHSGIESLWRWMARHPTALLTSYALVVLEAV